MMARALPRLARLRLRPGGTFGATLGTKGSRAQSATPKGEIPLRGPRFDGGSAEGSLGSAAE